MSLTYMGIQLIITIIIAIGGWGFGLYQMFKNRRWQQKDLLANRRYEAYSSFMKKLEEINKSIRNNPNMIYGFSNELIQTILNGNKDDMNNALLMFNQKIIDFVRTSTEPLMIINQEISSLLLISSDALSKKLLRLKDLNIDFNNEMRNYLSVISAKDPNSFKILETMGHDIRWAEFQELNNEIITLMRKEINID